LVEVKTYKKIYGSRLNKFALMSVLAGNKKYQLLCANCNWIKRNEIREKEVIKLFGAESTP
jgi:hypothetical protein